VRVTGCFGVCELSTNCALPVHRHSTTAPGSGQFIDHVLEKLPFRVDCMQTDNGSEFKAGFHWHVLDPGINHVYIKPATPGPTGKSWWTDPLRTATAEDHDADVTAIVSPTLRGEDRGHCRVDALNGLAPIVCLSVRAGTEPG
jgi:hypothetical protein